MIQRSRLISVLLAGCAGAGIVILINGRSRQVRFSSQEKMANANTSQELTFRRTAIFDGSTEDGARFAEHFYKSSDCVSISEETIFFGSTSLAQRELERKSTKAASIIERGPKSDDTGQHVGERIVLAVAASPPEKAYAEIIWSSGPTFHSLVAPSLSYILEFEEALSSRTARISSRIDDVQQLTFTGLETINGRTEEGFVYSEKQFRSSDCVTVTARTEYFSSPARAREELLKKLKESTNVIEREPKLDAKGEQVGERAVAMFKAQLPSESIEDTVVMWTINSELRSIKGLFSHVLELEKRNYLPLADSPQTFAKN